MSKDDTFRHKKVNRLAREAVGRIRALVTGCPGNPGSGIDLDRAETLGVITIPVAVPRDGVIWYGSARVVSASIDIRYGLMTRVILQEDGGDMAEGGEVVIGAGRREDCGPTKLRELERYIEDAIDADRERAAEQQYEPPY